MRNYLVAAVAVLALAGPAFAEGTGSYEQAPPQGDIEPASPAATASRAAHAPPGMLGPAVATAAKQGPGGPYSPAPSAAAIPQGPPPNPQAELWRNVAHECQSQMLDTQVGAGYQLQDLQAQIKAMTAQRDELQAKVETLTKAAAVPPAPEAPK